MSRQHERVERPEAVEAAGRLSPDLLADERQRGVGQRRLGACQRGGGVRGAGDEVQFPFAESAAQSCRGDGFREEAALGAGGAPGDGEVEVDGAWDTGSVR